MTIPIRKERSKKVKTLKDAALTASSILMNAAQEAEKILEKARIEAQRLLESQAMLAQQINRNANEQSKKVIGAAFDEIDNEERE